MMTEYDDKLDLKGLNCPLPILKAKKRLYELGAGQTLCVLADDPGSVKDFQAFSRQTGNELLDMQELDDHYLFVLRKRPD
jgi:tRNA 2-thiouridine synthesizing protein A